MIKNRKLAVVLALILSGCTSLPTEEIISRVEGTADKVLAVSESGVCEHPSVRALMARYQTQERLAAWFKFCYPGLHNPFEVMQ